jgi:hypothetical protein
VPRFVKDDLTIETAIPREAAQLRAQGFTEQKARTKAVKQAEAEATKPAEAPTTK